jgi:hypothetical protein
VAPLQPVPLSVQVTPLLAESFCTVAVNGWAALAGTLAMVSDSVTAMTAGGAVTVIVAAADLVASATDVAVSVTVAGAGTATGAVYVMAVPEALEVVDRVPHRALLLVQPAPESAQVTPLFAESFCTVAAKGCIAPVCTLAVVSERTTATGGGAAVTVIVVEADFVVSATEVTVTVTVAGVGTLAGAV